MKCAVREPSVSHPRGLTGTSGLEETSCSDAAKRFLAGNSNWTRPRKHMHAGLDSRPCACGPWCSQTFIHALYRNLRWRLLRFGCYSLMSEGLLWIRKVAWCMYCEICFWKNSGNLFGFFGYFFIYLIFNYVDSSMKRLCQRLLTIKKKYCNNLTNVISSGHSSLLSGLHFLCNLFGSLRLQGGKGEC